MLLLYNSCRCMMIYPGFVLVLDGCLNFHLPKRNINHQSRGMVWYFGVRLDDTHRPLLWLNIKIEPGVYLHWLITFWPQFHTGCTKTTQPGHQWSYFLKYQTILVSVLQQQQQKSYNMIITDHWDLTPRTNAVVVILMKELSSFRFWQNSQYASGFVPYRTR